MLLKIQRLLIWFVIGLWQDNGALAQADIPSGYWQGTISHLGKQWKIALEFAKDAQNKTIGYVDFLEISGYRRLFTISYDKDSLQLFREQPGGRPPLRFKGKLSPHSFSGSFDGIGITGASFAVQPAYQFGYKEEDIFFYNDTIKLAGTLLTPKTGGPFPAVVFTHGSEPATRSIYYGIAMQFVQKGIAALIYDKRSVGESGGTDYRTAGITNLATDALAGVQVLKKRKDIDAKRIGVFGHSQGGWIAPMTAVLSKDVSFIIASAASAVSAGEQSVFHRQNIMRQDGFSEEAVQKATGIRQRMNAATKLYYTDSVAARKALKQSEAEIASVLKEPWFESAALPRELEINYPGDDLMELLFKDPVSIWQKVTVPVYLVWGLKDNVVPVDKRGIIEKALQQAGNKKVTVKLWATTDHSQLFIPDSNEWDFPREQPGYFEEMAEWVLQLAVK